MVSINKSCATTSRWKPGPGAVSVKQLIAIYMHPNPDVHDFIYNVNDLTLVSLTLSNVYM